MSYLVSRDPSDPDDPAAGWHVTVWPIDPVTDTIAQQPALRIPVDAVDALVASLSNEASAIRQLVQRSSHQSNAASS